MEDKKLTKLSSSFRDPSGFIFCLDGIFYRQINEYYRENYEMMMTSGLYAKLIELGLMVPHEEVELDIEKTPEAYKIIKPTQLEFVSYPYEWSFSQLKDAALATLRIQKIAFHFGMSLKDCSAYNIQFYNGKPIFIDTLSFEKYPEDKPWVAYKQYCQHFLAPLALMSYNDVRMNQLLRIYIDGVPIDLASSLLPGRTNWKLGLKIHIHMHAKSQKKYADKGTEIKKTNIKVSKTGFQGLIASLVATTKKLKWKPEGTEWGEYYDNTNYSGQAEQHKKDLVASYLDICKPQKVWDLGANNGYYSRIASAKDIPTVAFDIDPSAVEKNYLEIRAKNEKNILSLVLDLTNPSPGIGWDNDERESLTERKSADTIFALALIHHLAISNNLPFSKIAQYFAKLCNYLIIEFVPKQDSKVQKLLASREDIFPMYDKDNFEKIFSEFFTIEKSDKIEDSERTLFLMKRK